MKNCVSIWLFTRIKVPLVFEVHSDLLLWVFCQRFKHIFFFPTWASYLNQLILQVSVTLRCGNSRSTIYETYRYADQVFLRSLLPDTLILKHVQNSDLLTHNRKPNFTRLQKNKSDFGFLTFL